MLKMVKPFVTDESINDFCQYITEEAGNFSKKQLSELDPEQTVIGIAYFEHGVLKLGHAILTDDFRLIAINPVGTINEVAKKLVKNL